MVSIENIINKVIIFKPYKIILSNVNLKKEKIRKIIIKYKKSKKEYYQIEYFRKNDTSLENIEVDYLKKYLIDLFGKPYMNLDAWDDKYEYNIKLSKKEKIFFTKKKSKITKLETYEHNRKKNYILKEGEFIEPLIDIGVISNEGKIIHSMYDKYKQINRFIELIDDFIKNEEYSELDIIDFGCGKSYLTFIIYHYFTVIRKIKVNMTGFDLKENVIKKCNEVAKKYSYENLNFICGDISKYKGDNNVDIVITLHACDTATDYAIYNAINFGAKMIFSVPCCQHELNLQIKSEELISLTRYGIVKERISSLMTDAIRGQILEYCGYKTQLIDFVKLEHTPKNILIRATKTNIPKSQRIQVMENIKKLCKEFDLNPKLLRLICNK
ncbi:MAG: SAM-dependent methyltransferase [Clostridiales bacterium]